MPEHARNLLLPKYQRARNIIDVVAQTMYLTSTVVNGFPLFYSGNSTERENSIPLIIGKAIKKRYLDGVLKDCKKSLSSSGIFNLAVNTNVDIIPVAKGMSFFSDAPLNIEYGPEADSANGTFYIIVGAKLHKMFMNMKQYEKVAPIIIGAVPWRADYAGESDYPNRFINDPGKGYNAQNVLHSIGFGGDAVDPVVVPYILMTLCWSANNPFAQACHIPQFDPIYKELSRLREDLCAAYASESTTPVISPDDEFHVDDKTLVEIVDLGEKFKAYSPWSRMSATIKSRGSIKDFEKSFDARLASLYKNTSFLRKCIDQDSRVKVVVDNTILFDYEMWHNGPDNEDWQHNSKVIGTMVASKHSDIDCDQMCHLLNFIYMCSHNVGTRGENLVALLKTSPVTELTAINRVVRATKRVFATELLLNNV